MYPMGRFVSLFAILFLAVFAASTIVHTVSANAMALGMATAQSDMMPDGQGCVDCEDGNPDAAVCNLVCTAPAIAMLKGVASLHHTVSVLRHDRPIGTTLPRGLRAPPDPFPPRILI